MDILVIFGVQSHTKLVYSSGSCCPYGADAFCISRMVDIDRLEQLEDEAEEAILEAQQLLAKARDSVTQHSIVHSSVSPTLSTQLSGVRARELTFLDEIEEGEEEEVQDFEKEQSDVERVPGQINRDIRRRKSTVEMSWQIASDLTKDSQRSKSQRRYAFSKQNLVSGRWHAPTIYSFKISVYSTIRRILSWRVFRKQTNPLFGQSTYAVVTFTSRQAAIAARQCLADANSEVDRWIEIGDIPVPPLADTPPWNLLDFRGLCRPVTFTITEHRKRSRRHL